MATARNVSQRVAHERAADRQRPLLAAGGLIAPLLPRLGEAREGIVDPFLGPASGLFGNA